MNKNNLNTKKISPIYTYWFVIITLVLILFARLFYLQIIHKADFRLQSDQNRIREVTIQPLRGLIYDRYGKLLVNNDPAFTLYALPYYFNENPEMYEQMVRYTGSSSEDLKRKVKRDMLGYFKPVRLLREVDFPTVSKFEENKRLFPGVDFWIEPLRSYPSEVKAAHLFGYLGEISAPELEGEYKGKFQKGDLIGKKGIEKEYEEVLHGKPGVRYAEVDVVGREIRTLENPKPVDPIPGSDLYLTIDADLQLLAEQIMDGIRGSVIMMDLSDGGILTLVSKPDYSPSDLSGIISPEVWNKLLNDPDHPLYDRSIQSVFPPGSTFKLVTALAALSKESFNPEKKVNCVGYYQFGRRPFKCWNAKGHGSVNLYQAIEQSCNVYFYKLGLDVGIEKWAEYSNLLLFGKQTGIDLPSEESGNLPDKQYLDNQYGEGKWTQGLMLNLSVGQGDLVVTPLQMLQVTSTIAKKGVAYKPHLRLYQIDPISKEKIYFKPDSSMIPTIPDTAYQIVRKGMKMVVHGTHGTAKASSVPNVISAGKTGTAQNPHGKTHAWFVGFAPFDKPKVAIVVFIENGGGGSVVAAPKAGKLLRLFFEKQKDEQKANQIIAQTDSNE